MTRHQKLPTEVLQALTAADRKPGWNNRPGDIKSFDLGHCRLYVVPCRRWAYRRQELRAQEWRVQQLDLLEG